MRRTAAFLAVGSLCLTFAAYAQKDPPIGSRLGTRDTLGMAQDSTAAVRAGHRMAGCAYLKSRTAAQAMLDTPDRAEAERQLRRLNRAHTCINLMTVSEGAEGQRMRIPNDIYRGMIAEAALRQDVKAGSLAPLPLKAEYAAPWFAATGRNAAVDELGMCVAETNPAGVRALLSTTAETSEEARAMATLSPFLGPCLAANAKLQANRQSLRAVLAEALYHRARDPAVSEAVK